MALLKFVRRAAALAVALASMGLAPASIDTASLEYRVKAAYLAKFGIFVQWPQSAFETPQSPVMLCVAGNDPFGDTLDKLVEGQKVDGRPIVVKRIAVVERRSGCEILYIGGTDEQQVSDALTAVNGASVLTVTDDGHTTRTTGMVDFVVQDNRVRFVIDDRAAAHSGILISSHLLSLALSVKTRG